MKELRAQVEWFRKQRGEAGQEGQSGPARRWSGLEEGWGMEVEEEETLRSSRLHRRKFKVVFKKG